MSADKKDGIDETIFSEVQLLLAEKRTALSGLRTGIAIFAFPLSVLSVLIMSLTEVRPWSGRDGALRRLRAVVGAERISKGVRFSTFVAPLLRGAGQRSALFLPPTSVNDIIPEGFWFRVVEDYSRI